MNLNNSLSDQQNVAVAVICTCVVVFPLILFCAGLFGFLRRSSN